MELQRCTLKGLASIGICSVGESFLKVDDKDVGGLGLDDHVVDVGFNVAADLLVEAHLDGPFVGRPDVFKFEGHGGVAIRTERRDE